MGEVGGTCLGLRLSGQGGVVHLESMGRNHTDISGNTVSKLHFNDVTNNELLSMDSQLLAATDNQGKLEGKQ